MFQPNVTAWTPHLLSQFLQATENICDLSCFKYIAISGSPMEKTILDNFEVSIEYKITSFHINYLPVSTYSEL